MDNFIELLLLLLVFADVFLEVFPVMVMAFFLLPLVFVRVDKIGIFALCIYPLPILFGSILYYYGIQGFGGYFDIFAFLLFSFNWLRKEWVVPNLKKAVFWHCLLYALLLVSVVMSTGGDYAGKKLFLTVQYGAFSFIAYVLMFTYKSKCNFIRIGLYYIICAYLMLRISPYLNNGAGPADLFDFGYLRRYNMRVLELETTVVDYQHVGFFAVMGFGTIMLHTMKEKISSLLVVVVLLLCTLVSLYSGARQFIIISVVLVGGWFFSLMMKKGISLSSIFIGAVALFLFVLLYGTLFSDEGMLSSVGEEGYLSGSGREFHILKGISDFLENPIFGIGYGRFSLEGKYGRYPHNLIIELLCELGIVGTLVVICLAFKPLSILFKHCKPSLYLVVVYFLRSMTSGGFDSNVMLFGLLFASCCFLPSGKKKKGLKTAFPIIVKD